MDNEEKLQLTSLRIPGGWTISFNAFWTIEPIIENTIFVNSTDFDEDLLVLERVVPPASNWLHFVIDLGWYPAENINGSYRLTLGIQNQDEDLKIYSSKDRLDIVAVLESWLHTIGLHPLDENIAKLL